MKHFSYQSKAAVIFAFIFLSLNVGFSVSAQNSTRQKIAAKPTPTPKTTPIPKPTVTPTPTPSPTPVAIQNLADLQSKIRLSLARTELRRGTVAVKIASLETGKILFENDAEKYVMPASNMKSFTVATALEKLSPDFHFTTSVLANSQPDASGIIKGDLTIFGRGDISISTAFFDGDYFKGLDALADKIALAGVKKIEGNLVGDDSYFSGSVFPSGWEWDDLQWYYGAEVSALPLNDNALDLSIKPTSSGAACVVQLQPFNPVMRVINRCVTSASGTKRDLTVKKGLEQNVLEVYGSMPVGDKEFKNYVTISRPAELFVALLKQRLAQKGIVVTGQTKVVGTKEKSMLSGASTGSPVEIAKLDSPPLAIIAAKTMKPSQNMYTETILWTLGEQAKNLSLQNLPAENILNNPKAISADKGLFVVQNFLQQIGVAPDGIVQYDGSGLSRHNLVTANSLVQLYTYMAKRSRFSQAWKDSLTIAGIDGTLKSRFVGTIGAGNVRGKTGTIDQVSALSGYVTTASGEPIVFSIIVNGITNSRTRSSTIDEIVLSLANFNGKIN